MRILATNDDGIYAEGFRHLVSWAQKIGEVTVCAPKGQQSGKSQSLNLHSSFEVKKVEYPGAVEAYYVDSTPADCVRFAFDVLGHFDLVLSGVNCGYNIGDDIAYSGTCGAMFDAAFWSSKAIAFSCSFSSFDSFPKYINRVWECFESNNLLEKADLWNVNFPDIVEGITFTRQGGAYVQDHFHRVEGDIWTQRGYYIDKERENGIDQKGAHDALVDVRATINVARLIKKNQPRLWDWALNIRDKDNVKNVVNVLKHEPFLHTSSIFVSEKGNTHPCLPLFYSGKSEIWCFDLLFDIPSNPNLSDYKETGLFKLNANRCPFVAPLNTLDKDGEKRLGFTKEEVLKRARYIIERKVFDKEKLLETIPEFENTEKDPDVTIYGSFLSRDDKKRLAEIRKLPPSSKLSHHPSLPFDDEKYHKLVWRQVARNWPEVLSDSDKKKWRNWCASRLISPPIQNAQSLENYRSNCKKLMESMEIDGEKKKIIASLLEYGDWLEDTVIKE